MLPSVMFSYVKCWNNVSCVFQYQILNVMLDTAGGIIDLRKGGGKGFRTRWG